MWKLLYPSLDLKICWKIFEKILFNRDDGKVKLIAF